MRQSPLEVLNPYFGSTPIFALDHPLTVLKGQIVALTVPTWAPMFAFNVEANNTWRGSRLPEHCASKEDIQGGHPQQGVGKTKTYGCYYSQRAPALHGHAWSRNRRSPDPVAGASAGYPSSLGTSSMGRPLLSPGGPGSLAPQNVRRGTRRSASMRRARSRSKQEAPERRRSAIAPTERFRPARA